MFIVPSRRGFTGATLAVLNMALGLAKLKVRVYVVTTRPPRPYMEFLGRIQASGVKVYVFPRNPPSPLYWIYLWFKALAVALKVKPSIIHPHLPKVSLISMFISKLLSIPMVFTLEGDPLYEVSTSRLLRKALTYVAWWVARKSSVAICPCSSWLASLVSHRHPEIKGKVYPVPNPVDYERFVKADPQGVREELGVKGLMVFTAARLDKVKGVDVLVKAASLLKREGVKATFIVAGEGPLREELERIIREFGLIEEVKLVGFRGDVERLTAACDVAVLPSIYEPFGMPAAEAGACGKPVVVSDVGGLREIVDDGVTGFVVPRGDYRALAKAIALLLSDQETRERLGRAAREKVMANFTPEKVALRLLKVYLRALRS